jgi:hypothetical protein
MITRAALRHGRMASVSVGRVAVTFLSNPELDGEPVRVELVLLPDGQPEQEVTIREGERFAFGPQTWVLEGVDNVGTYDYVVRIAAVPAS